MNVQCSNTTRVSLEDWVVGFISSYYFCNVSNGLFVDGPLLQCHSISCYHPDFHADGLLTSLELTGYLEGETIDITCSNSSLGPSTGNYSTIGMPLLLNTMCVDGHWSGPIEDLYCRPQACLYTPTLGIVGDSITILKGESADFTCEPGYYNGISPPNAYCNLNRELEVNNNCVAVWCPVPPSVTSVDGILQTYTDKSHLMYGETLNVECHNGTILTSHEPVVCRSDETFSDIPQCQHYCSFEYFNGTHHKNVTVLDKAVFQPDCDPSYEPSIQNYTCDAFKILPIYPTCSLITCEVIHSTLPEGMDFNCDVVMAVGNKCDLICPGSYEPSISALYCLKESRKIDASQEKCLYTGCPSVFPDWITGDCFNNEYCNLAPKLGYTSNDTLDHITCPFNISAIEYDRVACNPGIALIDPEMKINCYSGHKYGDKCDFSCNYGFVLIGDTQVTCEANGTLNLFSNMCIIHTCSENPIYDSTLLEQVDCIGYNNSDICRTACKDGLIDLLDDDPVIETAWKCTPEGWATIPVDRTCSPPPCKIVNYDKTDPIPICSVSSVLTDGRIRNATICQNQCQYGRYSSSLGVSICVNGKFILDDYDSCLPTSCVLDSDCGEFICLDGHCCREPCSSTCHTCSSNGSCIALPNATPSKCLQKDCSNVNFGWVDSIGNPISGSSEMILEANCMVHQGLVDCFNVTCQKLSIAIYYCLSTKSIS